jgi:molecular chaperone GrpE (heat shock protein)
MSNYISLNGSTLEELTELYLKELDDYMRKYNIKRLDSIVHIAFDKYFHAKYEFIDKEGNRKWKIK